jgi:hypothetical protein
VPRARPIPELAPAIIYVLSMSFFKIHSEVLYRYPKKAETFSLVFASMFVVLLMRPPYGQEIGVLSISDQWNPLMNKNIVYKEIRHTIDGYAHPYKEYVIII